jgi:hypothetical protein
LANDDDVFRRKHDMFIYIRMRSSDRTCDRGGADLNDGTLVKLVPEGIERLSPMDRRKPF